MGLCETSVTEFGPTACALICHAGVEVPPVGLLNHVSCPFSQFFRSVIHSNAYVPYFCPAYKSSSTNVTVEIASWSGPPWYGFVCEMLVLYTVMNSVLGWYCGSYGAVCKLCETSGWKLSSVSICASNMSISGAPRPVPTDGPGWSDPSHVHADSLCPGSPLS